MNKTLSWKDARVLVTGGHGFLGSHLVERLRLLGCRELATPTHAEAELRDRAAMNRFFEGASYDVVFHLAASVGGIGANKKQPADFFTDNALMGIHILDACARHKVGRLVLLGTICAYPKFAPLPFREETLWEGYPEETNAPYGVAKRALLVGADGYRQQYGLKYVGIFPTNLYGPRDDFDLETSHVIAALIRKCETAIAKKETRISLWGTGTPSRDFLYVDDAVSGLVLAAETPGIEGEIFNLGSEREVSIRQLAQFVMKATGFRGEFSWDPSKPDGQPRRCVSAEKANKAFGFKTSVSLEEGIGKTVSWFRENQKI